MCGEQPEKLSLSSQPALEKGPEIASRQQQGFPQQTSHFLSVHPHTLGGEGGWGAVLPPTPVVCGLFFSLLEP